MTISFYTLGCKVNQYESEAICEIFEQNGFLAVPYGKASDITVINSCTVTAESDRKTRQIVRHSRKLNPDGVIVLTGCMVQAFPEKALNVIEADVVVGNTDYDKLYNLCMKHLESKQRIFAHTEHKTGEQFTPLAINKFSEHTRAYIKIEDGCNMFCSYCIIPYARGRVRSKSVEAIELEAQCLANSGYKEVVLVGINLSSYGQDIGLELCDAVEAVSKCEGIKRVRLGSLECDRISDNALNRLAKCEKFCPQFHLSLQSGCDKTLKEMNRKYNTSFFRDQVKAIRQRFDNPSITTDIMVGFCGESDEDFNASCDFVKEIGFARSHVFAYSVREGTAAAKRTDFVENSVKQERSRIMLGITKFSEKAFLQSQIGCISNVLFETCHDGFWEGYTENYTRVLVNSKENLEGAILPVKLVKTANDHCFGEILY